MNTGDRTPEDTGDDPLCPPKWLVSEGLKKLISLIPSVGALLGFFLGKLISVALDAILSTKFVNSIKQKFQKTVNTKTYQIWDYVVAYFKCWA